MQIIKTNEDIKNITDNKIIGGENITFNNSQISFTGRNNVLFCEEGVTLSSSNLKFNGDGCLIYLSKNSHAYMLDATLYRDSVLFFGKNNYFNGAMHIILSERKHAFIGSGNLISFGVWLRTADPHLIYSVKTMKRINPSKSVFIGDHIWIGQGAMLLKGTQISSGSIIGAMALVSGKHIPSNESWGGNPAKKISDGIFWDNACVHAFDEEKTEKSMEYSSRKHIFKYKSNENIPFLKIDEALSSGSVENKIDYIKNFSEDKNRFAQSGETVKKRKLFR